MQLLSTPPVMDHQAIELEPIDRSLPTVDAIFEAWSRSKLSEATDALKQREQQLGVATLSSMGLYLLYQIASQFVDDLHLRIFFHKTTQRAAETQTVLPKNVLVQKTVSVEMAGKLLLWTCVGQRDVEIAQRRAVSMALGLPLRAAKQCSINLPTCCPEEEFGMMRGMVSPFLPPLRPNRLTAVVMVPWPLEWEYQGLEVAVSLSLLESLILPLSCFRTILRQYAMRAYTKNVLWIELPSDKWH